jgi:glucose-6-phosphate isomerase
MQEGTTSACAQSASILALHYAKGIRIHDLFLFDPALEGIGKWYRQLLGESIGKKGYNNEEAVGFVPTVSIGSMDLHAVAQRYLAGPRDMYTTFVMVTTPNHELPTTKEMHNHMIEPLHAQTMADVMKALLRGTQSAYRARGLPFSSMTLAKKDAYTLGQWMQWKMIETMYVGSLLKVNPFDQPDVELYKQETRKILSNA